MLIRQLLAAAAVLLVAWTGPAPAEQRAEQRAALPPAAAEALVLPTVLSDSDVALYRKIFALQKKGHWKAADKRIRQLGDRLLMGHVLAQRYLHPTAYRSRYKELKAWMADYADHPEAPRIYKLALRRKPRNWKYPARPVRVAAATSGISRTAVKKTPRIPRKRLSKAQRREVNAYKRKIRRFLLRGATKSVKQTLREKRMQRLFPQVDYDVQRAKLAAAYLGDGRVEWALQWALAAAKRSGKYVPKAYWLAGLASWQLGRHGDAAGYFEHALTHARSAWGESAAAFWAARAHLVGRQPARFNDLMHRAAAHPRTFYGLLAARVLGLPSPFRWGLPPGAEAAMAGLTASAEGRRALALVQAGQQKRAESELRRLAAGADADGMRAIMTFAGSAGMPSLALRLDHRYFPGGGGIDGAAYPAPAWTPKGGFKIDRALIYAIIRQESRFNPRARSWCGASGLMQLMPATASYIARDRGYRRAKRKELLKPEVSIALGQKYIAHLLREPAVKGDLLLWAAAWNGGPGNLNKWRRKTKHAGDVLSFIESIPSRETRDFIEKVLANLWIYRDRLGQPSPSLDALAAGERPVYTALDSETLQVAKHDKNRR